MKYVQDQKKRRRDLLFPGAVLLTILVSCTPDGLIEKSEPWDQIRYHEYLVENNTWNVQAAKSQWTETIFYDTIRGSMGWKWDFSGEDDEPDSFVVKSFPEIIVGRKPYDGYQPTTTRLPAELSAARFSIGYEYLAEATGIYNTSTDISFTDNKNPKEGNIRAKMMIWFDRQNMPFFESATLKEALIAGQAFKIYSDTTHVGPEGKWTFIALLPDHFPRKGEINLKEYIDYFLSEGILRPEWYLSSIEIGSEIASGTGKITFKRFVVY